MKKIIFIVVILLLIIIIGMNVNYNTNYDLSIGNDSSYYSYIYYDTRIEDIINDIDNNIYIKNKHIQNILVKSNNIVIDLNGLYINNKSIYYVDILLSIIRKYSKERIIIILRKENDILSNTMNNMIFKLKDKYDIIIKR